MKKVFLAAALFAFLGAGTASATSFSKANATEKGDEGGKKGKKGKKSCSTEASKGKGCCADKTKAAEGEKKTGI